MGIVQITIVGIVSAVFALMLKKDNPQFALLVTIAASTLILLTALPWLGNILPMVDRIAGMTSGGAHITTILKMLGIAYAAEFGAQICIDAGETAIASKIEIAGKLLMTAIAAPVTLSLLEQVLSLMG